MNTATDNNLRTEIGRYIDATSESWMHAGDPRSRPNHDSIISAIRQLYRLNGLQAPNVKIYPGPDLILQDVPVPLPDLRYAANRRRIDQRLEAVVRGCFVFRMLRELTAEHRIARHPALQTARSLTQLIDERHREIQKDHPASSRSIIHTLRRNGIFHWFRPWTERIRFVSSPFHLFTLGIAAIESRYRSVSTELKVQLQLCSRLMRCTTFWLGTDQTAWVCESPEIIRRSAKGTLHNPDGPAARWSDGTELYAYEGEAIPEMLITIPVEKWKASDVRGMPNAVARRLFVQKFGLDRICAELGQVLDVDVDGKYALVDPRIHGHHATPYLLMLNPSTGARHIEGVHPTCETVKHALQWRNSSALEPLVLT